MRGIRLFVVSVFALGQVLIAPVSLAMNDMSTQDETEPDTGLIETEAEATTPYPVITEIQVSAECKAVTCKTKNSSEFVELYNPSDTEIVLSGYKLLFRSSGGKDSLLAAFDQTATLPPKQFGVVVRDMDITAITTMTLSNGLTDGSGAVLLVEDMLDIEESEIVDQVAWGSMTTGYYGEKAITTPKTDTSAQRCFVDGVLESFDPRSTVDEFIIYENDLPTPGSGLECIVPLPIVDCSGVVINEIGANVDDQYIELFNTTEEPIEITGCLLQTNRSSQTYQLTQGELGSGEYLAVTISETNLILTKTTTGIVYLLTSDGLVEVDVQEYSELDEDTSWSYFEDGWLQTYALTPGEANVDEPYPACDEGYFRNTETGRCNLVQSNTLKPCKVGQYRSLETNRCRNVLSPITLKPCSAGQYRNPETNRCRKASLASALKPCDRGQYRNPATNRCKKKINSSIPSVGYKVEPVSDSTETFAGWWAMGGVGAIAGGYAGWEWRRELVNSWYRVLGLFKK